MIRRSKQFDLGLDRTRIKDPRDARRQEVTVDALLKRLFHPQSSERWELQIVADEVGMGKTFVALGTAYSLLEAMQEGAGESDLGGCYQKVLIVTPTNSALFAKWRREVGEFVKRCVRPEFREHASRWFSAVAVERIDELSYELRRPGTGPKVIIASTNIFGGGKLRHYDEKRRHLLRALFRYWGTRFKGDERIRLLKGAPSHWPTSPEQLDELAEAQWDRIMFSQDELIIGLRQLDSPDGPVEKLLKSCREIAAPFVRNRDEQFATVERQLVDVYRELMATLLQRSLPLVIVDEAHNWKNGPLQGSNGYAGFVDLIGSRTRRAILLTATPFQLRPEEMLEILKVGDHLKTCPSEADSHDRRDRLRKHRENVIRPILKDAATTSIRFTKAWSRIPFSTTPQAIESVWNSPAVQDARIKLNETAARKGRATKEEIDRVIEAGSSAIDPEVRQLIREALRLYVFNADLSHELGSVVIRHRRHSGHRLFKVGAEYQPSHVGTHHRSDRHLLHAAPGVDVRGEGELPHYLLMRCVSEMKKGKGRSSLGSALTGCYSTLIDSAEGRSVQKQLNNTDSGQMYLKLLMQMVDAKQDPQHPKVREVVDAVLANWNRGEKTLIFCFRTNTARRLHEIIDQRIRDELNRRRDRCMGGADSLKTLRTRLTGKDRDLIVLGLDRVLWSILWSESLAEDCGRRITLDDLELRDSELEELASLALRYRIDVLGDRIDRVFLHRVTEHLIAKRWLKEVQCRGNLKRILLELADEAWLVGPYGLTSEPDEDHGGAEAAHFDERGVHSVYVASANADPDKVARVTIELRERRTRARRQNQVALLDAYQRGPNLWLGANPREMWVTQREGDGGTTLRSMHRDLFGLSIIDGATDWQSRRLAMQAIRRAVLRESVLLRLLPEKHALDEGGWGELLVRSFFGSLPGQLESMADRIGVFLEDLLAASGSLSEADQGSARFALLDATRLRDQQFVALVSGSSHSRERVFSGFNTPLLPEVLICTSVGQEGIDLHRHCRHVVHFDLAWNPAVLEQRTGRVDRIGSKTFRERARCSGIPNSFLDIGVPYLAGTYDERMYEELRLRAQTFEVLTGGDAAAGDAVGLDDRKQAEGEEAELHFVQLPQDMMEGMRVKLHVWEDNHRPDELPE